MAAHSAEEWIQQSSITSGMPDGAREIQEHYFNRLYQEGITELKKLANPSPELE